MTRLFRQPENGKWQARRGSRGLRHKLPCCPCCPSHMSPEAQWLETVDYGATNETTETFKRLLPTVQRNFFL